MAVVNTTYNFNQGNMNFLQSMLYGGFGQLTGGMGCLNGFGFGGFGMGGSIFPMGTMMTGYNCLAGMGGCYSDQMLGLQIGSMVSGVVVGGIMQSIDGKGSKGDKIKSLETEIKELDKNNTDEYIKKNLDPSFEENIDSAKKHLKSLTQSRDRISANLIASQGEYKNMPEKTEEEKAAKEKFKKENIDPLQAELDKLNGKDGKKGLIAEAKESVEAAENAEQDEIKRIKGENDKLIAEKNEELEEIASGQLKLSRKCDSEDEYNKIINPDNKITSKNSKDFVKAFNFKFSQYCNASNSKEKKAAAEDAIKIYNDVNGCTPNAISNDMMRNMKIMQSYCEKGNNHGLS